LSLTLVAYLALRRGTAVRVPAGCPPGAEQTELCGLLAGDRLGLTFSVAILAGHEGGPVTSAAARRYFVEMQFEPAHRTLRDFTSMAVDPRGRVIEKVRWQAGWKEMIIADERDCLDRKQPLPTALDLTAVLEDMIGPFDLARREGARQLSPGVFEYHDGPASVKITVGDGRLRGRRIEVFSHGGRAVSRTSDIALGAGPVIPAGVRAAPCSLDPRIVASQPGGR
jgi:hypothetical protein